MSINKVILIIAVIVFALVAILDRSLIALGLALFAGSFLV